MKLPAFSPPLQWAAPSLASLPSWKNAERIAIDIETHDPDLRTMGPGVRTNGSVIGVAFAIEGGPAAYLPMRHRGGGNLDEAQVWAYLRDQARETQATIVHANGQYDHDYLLENGVDLLHCPWFDVQIADPIIYELHMRYSLDHIAGRWGVPGKDEVLLRRWAECYGIDPKTGMWHLPAGAVGPYAEQDVRLPLQLARMQEKRIQSDGLEEIFAIESKLQPVLLKMRRRGVRVDTSRLGIVRSMAQEREAELLREITRRTGIGVDTSDVNSSASWARVLKSLGIGVPQTASGNPSVTRAVLNGINHPVSDLIIEAKKFNKLYTTFCSSIERFAVKGRIHCTFNQTRTSREDGSGEEDGAKYGRLSCKNLNIQQQPSPDKDPVIGKAIRNLYMPDEGGEWGCFDFSSQEPRWTVHYAELIGAPKAKEAGDRYRSDPSTDYHGMVATMIEPEWPNLPEKEQKLLRSRFKNISLGKAYGMGGAKLCTNLGLPTKTLVRYKNQWLQENDPLIPHALRDGGFMVAVAGDEGTEVLRKFEEGVPYLSKLESMAERNAIRNGFIRTVCGRRCHFPPLKKAKKSNKHRTMVRYDWTHKALNRLIQGSAGDQIKKAMVDLDAAGIAIQLQVHDEIDLTLYSRDLIPEIMRIMVAAVPCKVPHKVDVDVGPRWGEISEVSV